MTVEEAFLVLVAVIAGVLLFLGLAEVLEGDPRASLRARRRGARRPGARRPPRGTRAPAEIEAVPDVQAAPRPPPSDPAGDPEAAMIEEEFTRLTGEAVRLATDDARAAGALEAAEALLGSLPEAMRPAERRARWARRLWRGYTRLGLRRWRAGNFEAAAAALFGALAPGIDARRRRLVHDLLGRALEDMAGQSLELIPQLLGEGDRRAAREQAERLLSNIHRARAEGVSPEDLAVAAARARQLREHLEQAPVP